MNLPKYRHARGLFRAVGMELVLNHHSFGAHAPLDGTLAIAQFEHAQKARAGLISQCPMSVHINLWSVVIWELATNRLENAFVIQVSLVLLVTK